MAVYRAVLTSMNSYLRFGAGYVRVRVYMYNDTSV